MKIKSIFSVSLLMSFFFVFGINSLSATTTILDPVGTYNFTVTDIPDIPDVKGTMTISKEDGILKVVFKSNEGTMALSNAKLEDAELTGELSAQGMILKLKGTFDGNSFSGHFNTDFGPLRISAEKQ